MGKRIRFGAGAAAALVTTLLSAAPASAGTACEQGGAAVFAAADVVTENGCTGSDSTGEVNHLTVNVNASGAVVFTDSTPIADGDGAGGCTVSGNTATCPGVSGYVFDLGDSNDSATVGNAASSGQSTGGAGDDTLAGGPLAGNLSGGDGNDTLTGGAGDDTLDGGTGNDSVSGGDGNDTVDGGAGNDVVGGGPGNDKVTGGAGDDQVSGGDGADVLDGDPTTGACPGSAGNDALNGDAGDDTLCAGDGPSAGPDADVIAGGDGFDHVYYPRLGPVAVSLDSAAGDGEAGENDNVLTDVEAVTGGAGNDTLTGNDGPNWLDGAGGSDVLNGMGGPDYLVDSGQDAGADTFNGGPGDDTLADAGGGPDTFNGGDGEDILTAYQGRSTSVNVSLDGIANDGGAGEGDNVGTDVEDVVGGSGDDTITGDAADNELIGGAGADTISGGDGNDGLEGGAGADVLDGGPGVDLLSGGAGSDQLKSRGDGVTDRDECGGGTDSVSADGRDDVAGDCENVSIAPPAPATINSIVVTRAGFVVVRITCPIVEKACGGVVIVKTVKRIAHRFISLGHVNYSRLHGGDSRFIRARIAPKDRRALRRARRVKVRAIVANTNGDTSVTTTTTKLATVTTRGLR